MLIAPDVAPCYTSFSAFGVVGLHHVFKELRLTTIPGITPVRTMPCSGMNSSTAITTAAWSVG